MSDIGRLDTKEVDKKGVQSLVGFLNKLVNFHEDELKYLYTSYINKSGQSGLDKLLFLFCAKNVKTLRAIVLLSNNGFGEDAAQLTRSIYEIYINTQYILQINTEDRTRLFLDFNLLDYFDRLTELKKEIKEEIILAEYEQTLSNYKKEGINKVRKFREQKEKEYKLRKQIGLNNKSWSLITTKQMAIETGNGKLYKQIYWQISQIAHPHPKGLENYFENKGKNTYFSDSPSLNWVSESLVFSSDMFLRFLELINKYFKLNIDKRTNLFREEFSQLLNEINKN